MFVVELEFGDAPGRLEARAAHRQILVRLHKEGTLVMAGPFADDAGALLIFDVPDGATLDRLMAADVYYQHPAVRVVHRREWSPILGAGIRCAHGPRGAAVVLPGQAGRLAGRAVGGRCRR